MDFFFRREGGNAHRLHFTEISGLCLSTNKRYSAVIIQGQVDNWAEGEGKVSYTNAVLRGKDWDYKVVVNLTCWDILELLEMEHIETETLFYMCYAEDIKRIHVSQNEHLDDYESDTTHHGN